LLTPSLVFVDNFAERESSRALGMQLAAKKK
jgi:hypothetical protein